MEVPTFKGHLRKRVCGCIYWSDDQADWNVMHCGKQEHISSDSRMSDSEVQRFFFAARYALNGGLQLDQYRHSS